MRSESASLVESSPRRMVVSAIVTRLEGLGGGGGGGVPEPVTAVISSGGGSMPEWSKRSSGAEDGLILLPSGLTVCQRPQESSKSSDGGTDADAEEDDGPAWLPPEG